MKVLERLANAACEAGDLLDAFLANGYGASLGKMEYHARQRKRQRVHEAAARAEYVRMLQRHRNVLAWLKRDGLAEERQTGGRKIFVLTAKGFKKMLILRKRHKNALPEKTYETNTASNPTIIVFDVPEKERRKRDWLRVVLGSMGFTMLQKSVWVGKVKVPKGFIDDLLELHLTDFVEIFEITKAGSLRHVV